MADCNVSRRNKCLSDLTSQRCQTARSNLIVKEYIFKGGPPLKYVFFQKYGRLPRIMALLNHYHYTYYTRRTVLFPGIMITHYY
jgi:hypothetical protein